MIKYLVRTLLTCGVFVFLCLLPPATFSQELHPPLDPEVEEKITQLLSRMELVDKVGEMTQLSIDMISVGAPYALAEPHRLDTAKLRKVLLEYRVGSILNVGGHAYTREHWQEIIQAIQKIAVEEKPTGIPVLYGIDAIHGNNYTLHSTLFPQQLAMAATWNLDLVRKQGEVTAYETRAAGIPWNFSPVLDVGRDPRWSRLWETFGEDVYLASQMGAALIEGNQGKNLADPYRVAACMKHFLGYSFPYTGKDRTQAWIPERQMREYFLPTFQKAIEVNAATIMICSGEMNGIPVHADKKILTDLLRDELGYTGLAVSDWEDIVFLHGRHRVSPNYKQSIKMAINAGIDMSMVPIDLEFPRLLKELVEEGEVPMSRIDEAVRRILRIKFQLGLFENTHYPAARYPKFASEAHSQASYDAAVEAITLLKNDKNLLPLSPRGSVMITGPTAHSLTDMNGGWSRTWQGTDPAYNTPGKKNIAEAIQQLVKDVDGSSTFIEANSPVGEKSIAQAVAQAKSASVAILCVGEHPYTEKPGDIDNLSLPAEQVKLVDAIAETGTPIILVIVGGRPRIISEIADKCQAILMAYLPGDEGGRAIADILFGKKNPSGKLPFTYPRHVNTLVPYDHKGTDLIKYDFSSNAFNPQFTFGHGLSYTEFAYSNLQVNKVVQRDEKLEISIDIENKGKRLGKEVVQVYVTDKVASITPAVKRLRAFDKITLRSGEKQTVRFSLDMKALSFVGRDNTWVLEPGTFEIAIGDQKAEILLEK